MDAPVHPRTSVVIPARNAATTLAETLDSLLGQTDPSWEALVVDDGSSDSTSWIIGEYAARDPRLVALQGPAAGVSAARNVALARARGRRLLFLDADDWVDSRFLESMNAALDSAPDAVVAYCNDRRVAPDGAMSMPRRDPSLAAAPFERFARNCPAAMCALMVDRRVVRAVGAFDVTLSTCQDWDLWQRVARTGGQWIHVDEPLSYYRIGENAQTHRVDRMLADAATVITRGFARDERLAYLDVVHPEGADPGAGGTAVLAYGLFALWAGAIDCVRGGNGDAAIRTLGTRPEADDFAHRIADYLIDGVMVGLCDVPARFAARWTEFGGRVAALVREAARAWNDPPLARSVQYAFERAVLDHDDLSSPRRLGLTIGMRVDVRDPPRVELPSGIDRLYARVWGCPGLSSPLTVGALGTITPRKWRSLAASCLGQRVLAAPKTRGSHDEAIERLRRQSFDIVAGVGATPTRVQPRQRVWLPRLVRSGRSGVDALLDAFRSRANRQERPIPVLVYDGLAGLASGAPPPRRIDIEAFRAQMAWLRGKGFHAIPSSELAHRLERDPVDDKPVVVGVIEPMQAFAQYTWPASLEAGLTVEIFVASHILRAASERGSQARGAEDVVAIARLASEGASFSVLLEGRADGRATRELAEELLRSRATLSALAGQTIDTLAIRASGVDDWVFRLAAECGFQTILTSGSGGPGRWGGVPTFSWIEVGSDTSLGVLSAKLLNKR